MVKCAARTQSISLTEYNSSLAFVHMLSSCRLLTKSHSLRKNKFGEFLCRRSRNLPLVYTRQDMLLAMPASSVV